MGQVVRSARSPAVSESAARMTSSFSLWTPAIRSKRAISAKQSCMVCGGMRGKRSGWVPKVENLKAAAPASTMAAMWRDPSSGWTVP